MKKYQNKRRATQRAALIAVTSLVILGQAQAQYGMYQAPPEKSFLEQFALPLVGQALGGVAGSVIQYFGGKLISALSAPEKAAPVEQVIKPPQAQGFPNQQPVQYNVPVNNAGMMNAVYQPAPPPITQNVGAVTGVMYAIDRLNSDYSIRETISPQAGVSPTFESREKFAIRYTSNQPGVVVIMNVDALQKTFYLGTFVVSPGADMRFPAETNKGMVLDDNVGLETYQMLFMACLPPEMTNQPDVIARKGQIPECGPTAQAEQTIMLAQKGRRTKGTYSEALPQADGARKVVLSVAPYQKGDVTVTTFTINHVPPVMQQPLQQQQWPSQIMPPAPAQPQPGATGTI
jgi:hypothetical protein